MANVLGEMIIKLTSESQSFDAGINTAEKKLNKFADGAKKLGSDLTKFITLPLVGLGALAVKEFAASEDAEAKFRAALIATGKQTEVNIESIKAYAKELQKTTIYSDDAQIASLGLLQSLANLSNDGIVAILPRMLDFSAAMGIDLESTASLFGKTLGSTTNALGRYGIQIDATASPTSKLAQLTEVLDSKFKNTAQTVAKTGTGPLKNFQNTLGDLAEEFGKNILPTITSLLVPIKAVIEEFGKLDDGTKKIIIIVAACAAAIGPLIGVVGNLAKVLGTLGAAGGPLFAVIALLGGTVAATIALKQQNDDLIASEKGFIRVVKEGTKTIEEYRAELEKKSKVGLYAGVKKEVIQKDLEDVKKQLAENQKKINDLKKGVIDVQKVNFAAGNDLQKQEAERRKTLYDLEQAQIQLNLQIEVGTNMLNELNSTTKNTVKENIPLTESIKQIQSELANELLLLEKRKQAFGDEGGKYIAEKQDLIRNAIEKLIEKGLSVESKVVQDLIKQYDELSRIIDKKNNADEKAIDRAKKYKEEWEKAHKKVAEAAEEEEKRKEKVIQQTADLATNLASDIGSIANQAYNNRLQEIDNEKTHKLRAEEEKYNAQKDAIEKNITDEDEKKSALEKLEQEKAASTKAIEDEIAAKRKEVLKNQFIANKTASIIQTIINTAIGISKCFAELGPWGAIPAAIIGALGAAQTAIIASQPVPEFKQGGFVPSTPGGQLVKVAEGGTGEFMVPERADVFNALADRITSNMQRPVTNNFSPNINMPSQMVVNIDGQQFKGWINEQSRRGNIMIDKNRGISKR